MIAVNLAQRFIDFHSGQRVREENDTFEEIRWEMSDGSDRWLPYTCQSA